MKAQDIFKNLDEVINIPETKFDRACFRQFEYDELLKDGYIQILDKKYYFYGKEVLIY